MHTSRLFWKLFLAYAGLVVVAATVLVVVVSSRQEQQIRKQIQERLQDSAILLRSVVIDDLPQGRSENLQQRVQRLGEHTDTRITVVAPDGLVLADSEKASLEQVAGMDNHKDRPELFDALNSDSGSGASRRESPTVGIPMLYYALRVERENETIGLVRLALPMTSVQAEVSAIKRLVWGVAAVVCLLVLVLTYVLVARIIRPIRTLTAAAEAIARGEYEHDVYVPHRDELGQLAASFNRMNREMADRVAQLRESGERLATVLGGMIEGVIAVDNREHVLFSNAAAGRLLGFDPAEAGGRALLETVRNHRLHEAALAALRTGEPQAIESEVFKRGETVLSVHATPLPGQPSPGAVLVLHDVTELRRLEMLRQEFVANVSHELKTPLSSIKAYSETLQNGAIEDVENRLKFVGRIEEQADRLHQLILDMLSLARIESGNEAFDIQPLPLADIVAACLEDHRDAAAAKAISLESTGGEPDVQVKGDREGLRQIVDNLIDNAVKYTPEGGRVTLRWQVEPAHVVVEVEDTGIGIAAQDQPRLFERFFRVDKARSRELGGTGLGLSIVKHLVQSFGGAIGVQSAPGRGSTFWVRLPRAL